MNSYHKIMVSALLLCGSAFISGSRQISLSYDEYYQKIINAIYNGQDHEFERCFDLLSEHPDTTSSTKLANFLMIASAQGHPKIIKLLLAKGVEVKRYSGDTIGKSIDYARCFCPLAKAPKKCLQDYAQVIKILKDHVRKR